MLSITATVSSMDLFALAPAPHMLKVSSVSFCSAASAPPAEPARMERERSQARNLMLSSRSNKRHGLRLEI
jgi:hypothetical protein